MGDFNSPPTDNNFVLFMEKNGLFDLIDSMNNGPPPRTYVDGRKRLGFVLGNEFVREAVEKSRTLGQHEGITSNHTLQWADLSLVKLFGTDHIPPMARNEREFTLAHAKKKSQFQKSVQEKHDLHKIESRIQALADDFTRADPLEEEGPKFRTLTKWYNDIDELVKSTLRHAATSVGQKNMGYQQSPELIHSIKKLFSGKQCFSA